MKISIIHPSRQRPTHAFETAKKWLSSMSGKIDYEYILSIDATDTSKSEYLELFKVNKLNAKIIVNDNRSAIEAINHGAKFATGDIFIVVSDDFDCEQNWDLALYEALHDKTDYIVKTNDGLQPWIITLPIMDRVYYERFGYIYYPGYKHMFCDTEMSHVADLLEKKINLPIKFQHRHYTQKNGLPKDEINIKNDNTWVQGETLYLERIKNNFGLSEFAGKLNCAEHHKIWLASKGVIL